MEWIKLEEMILASQLHAVKKKLRKEAFNNSGFDRT